MNQALKNNMSLEELIDHCSDDLPEHWFKHINEISCLLTIVDDYDGLNETVMELQSALEEIHLLSST